jgi:hypothetical protein
LEVTGVLHNWCFYGRYALYGQKQMKLDWYLHLVDVYGVSKANEPFIHPHLHTVCFDIGAVHQRELVLNMDREFTKDEHSLQSK